MDSFLAPRWFSLFAGIALWCPWGSFAVNIDATWRDSLWQTTLSNEAIEATFQAGIPIQIDDRAKGETLLSIDPAELPSILNLFGSSGVDLDTCAVSHEVYDDRIRVHWEAEDGTQVTLDWSLDTEKGDLVLRSSAKTPAPIEEFRFIFFGCDIGEHSLTWVNQLGIGHHIRGPREGRLFIGDPQKDSCPGSQIHPMVALFERSDAGWVITGREERIGPAAMLTQGHGTTVSIGFARRFPEQIREPDLFEIRIRPYRDDWRSAVDPYVDWMEKEVGYVPLEKKSPGWIKEIRSQAYVRVGDFDGLEALATRVNPAETFVGRMPGFRHHAMGTYGPDYRLTDTAKKWFRRARDLGFHVGAHFSAYHLSPHFPELMERFRPGFQITGKDKDGNPMYKTLPRWSEGAPIRVYYVSHAFEPWRKYFIEQLREAVEAGVDIIYLDEAAWPCGNPLVDGMTSVEGLIALEREILENYPNVAIQTEQFNPMASRHAAFALCQMSPGHPLGGYIFQKFVKVTPEGMNYQCTEVADWDGVASWGFMLPGADGEPSWLEIAKAFQQYKLVPDIGLPRIRFETYADDKRHGLSPVWDDDVASMDGKFFGYRGRDGVTAYFEKKGHRRGLVVYAPNREPQWVGERVSEVTSWPGPGVLRQLAAGVPREVDWFIYNDDEQLGLDPTTTYRLDRTQELPKERFHVTGIPEDFTFWNPNPGWIRPQNTGRDGSFFKLLFTGNGEMTAYVPGNVLVFLDGEEVSVNKADNTTRMTVSAPSDDPSRLVAFVKTDDELVGRLANLPWQVPRLQRIHTIAQHRLTDYSPQGPVPRTRDVNSFYTGVVAMIVTIGKLPEVEHIRIRGAYGMRKEAESRTSKGDGVIRINGKEVVRVPAGEKPYAIQSFHTDISEFAGRHVLIEFISDGLLLDPAAADWYEPQIVAKTERR